MAPLLGMTTPAAAFGRGDLGPKVLYDGVEFGAGSEAVIEIDPSLVP